MGGYGGRVIQSCQYFQTFVNHFQHKILLFQPLVLLLNQVVVSDWFQNTLYIRVLIAPHLAHVVD